MMDKYTKVEGHNGLVRAPNGAILNVDKQAITSARNRKKVWKEQQEELAQLRNDVAIMKQMMQQLLEDKNGSNDN
jgi:hypothetical protein